MNTALSQHTNGEKWFTCYIQYKLDKSAINITGDQCILNVIQCFYTAGCHCQHPVWSGIAAGLTLPSPFTATQNSLSPDLNVLVLGQADKSHVVTSDAHPIENLIEITSLLFCTQI